MTTKDVLSLAGAKCPSGDQNARRSTRVPMSFSKVNAIGVFLGAVIAGTPPKPRRSINPVKRPYGWESVTSAICPGLIGTSTTDPTTCNVLVVAGPLSSPSVGTVNDWPPIVMPEVDVRDGPCT